MAGATRGDRWLLREGRETVSTIVITGTDMPWLVGIFRPTERFANYRDAFDRELAFVDGGHLEDHLEEFEAIWADLHRDLALVKPDGTAVAEFLLHVRGEEAWFRYSDEPFS